jgi:hypothetical protein
MLCRTEQAASVAAFSDMYLERVRSHVGQGSSENAFLRYLLRRRGESHMPATKVPYSGGKWRTDQPPGSVADMELCIDLEYVYIDTKSFYGL